MWWRDILQGGDRTRSLVGLTRPGLRENSKEFVGNVSESDRERLGRMGADVGKCTDRTSVVRDNG